MVAPAVFSPVLTPFTADLSPDSERFVQHCRWLLRHDVGLAVFGTNSEGNSLSVPEKCELLDALIRAGLPTQRMLPATGSCSLSDAVALSNAATQAGSAGVLVLPPFYYNNPSEDGLFRFYAELVERVGDARLRIYLYHIPAVSGVPITAALVRRLLKAYPHAIAGMKDTGGDWASTESMIREFGPGGFGVFAGTETVLLAALRAGGPGCITATANVNPARIVHLARHWRDGGADELQRELNATREIFASYPLIAAMKSAVAGFRADEGWRRVRPPLTALSDGQHAELLQRLTAHGFTSFNKET
ncbi:dihydrodipicolinate synthase family protein [Xenophilus arseniciresistens]|uniref:Dihydrodipicolinate synthase family protein n=1 Tax=Xenophilus arseniciresistens TaxID=1283306 RepID=A0AAE3T012_9BURK|nr:dihydrodipicolinate synthase family protein [Xenophilus arseniciresistens]MDA7417095.1 dihydrodipicolinate synthase family protein [Xenophilus arseniciresistens]